MAGPIPEELIDRIRNHHDVLDVIGEYVPLKKRGRSFLGLCPFHSEKTPSFSVAPDKQIFRCFGCGVGGDVFHFIMKMEELDFVEAVNFLAKKAGIELPKTEEETAAQSEEKKEKQRMLEAHDKVSRLYHHILVEKEAGRKGLDYLYQRGFTLETVQEFQLGFAPNSWDFVTRFLQKRKYPLELMETAGLLSKREGIGRQSDRYFDRFRGRVMFPISDSQGRVIGFGGRLLDDGQPKYLNSPETRIFNKSRQLFNFHRARSHIRKARTAVLMEGYVDVITAWQAGIPNAVATLGTSLTEQQARLLRRNVDRVIVCYDSDRAGQEAALKAGKILTEAGCLVRVALMPQGMDPDDYIRKKGGKDFEENILLQSLTFTAFKLQHFKKQYDLNDEGERIQYIEEALKEISSLKSAVERDHYIRQLSDDFHLSLDALKAEQLRIYRKMKKYRENRDNLNEKWNNRKNNGKRLVAPSLLPAHHNAERFLLSLMMRDRAIAELVEEKIGGNFNVDEYAALSAYLYSYYAEGNEPDPGKFTRRLRDERLMEVASDLAMMTINEEVTEQEIQDCIRQVLDYPKKRHIEELQEEIKRLEKAENYAKAQQLGLEIIRLRKELKREA